MQTGFYIEDILFIDIETVSQYPEYELLPEKIQLLWDKKASTLVYKVNIIEEESPQSLYKRAGIYSEFGKIICISAGFVFNNDIRIKSFYGEDEKNILTEFAQLLETHFSKQKNRLCAHNGKEFDFPYIARRMLINGIKLPSILNLSGKKPWEIRHLDTLELWKFGDYKHYTSLDLLSVIFDIPSPKNEIDGSMVNDIYWKEKDLNKIVEYCEKDVRTVYLLFNKINTLL